MKPATINAPAPKADGGSAPSSDSSSSAPASDLHVQAHRPVIQVQVHHPVIQVQVHHPVIQVQVHHPVIQVHPEVGILIQAMMRKKNKKMVERLFNKFAWRT